MFIPSLFIGIGGGEIAFIIFIIVIVFGADKVPEIVHGLGKGIRSIKNATEDIKNEITQTAEDQFGDLDSTGDLKKEIGGIKDEIEELAGSVKRRQN